ncbi:MAG: Hsp33 family molecular chaperone HslO [Xanthomonadales bacterium]|nr:Hsp33 family molecular chaperone HslO [Xanthomonadales bacterium]
MEPNDVMHRFKLERSGVRGGFVRLESSWAEAIRHAHYPPDPSRQLGEALAASALLAGAIKFEGRLSIHLRDAGPLKLLFAECTSAGALRGIVRTQEAAAASGPGPGFADAQLAITIENDRTQTRYQGLVAVDAGGLATSLEAYFGQSEQLPTRIVLGQHGTRCGGLIVQKVAATGGVGAGDDEDGWDRVGHLLATMSTADLLDLPVETLLYRLFHDERVRLEPGRPLAFACSCSSERVEAMLRLLGREEGEAALDANGLVEVTCEFCGRSYRLDRVDLERVFAGAAVAPAPSTPQ